MIKNQHQYRVTKAQLARLEEAPRRAEEAKTGLQPALHKAVIAGLQAQVDEMREELEEYVNRGSRATPTVKRGHPV